MKPTKCSDFADLCLDFELRGDYEFPVPTRIYSDFLMANMFDIDPGKYVCHGLISPHTIFGYNKQSEQK